MLLGPDACQAAFTNADKAFANGPAWSELVGPFFKRGLMLLDFEEHHLHRRIMQEAFVRPRLEGYADGMHPAIERGLATLADDRPRVQGLPGAEGPDARRGRRHLHGRRRGRDAGGDGAGQRGVHRVRPVGRGAGALRPAAHAVGSRAPRARRARGVAAPLPAVATRAAHRRPVLPALPHRDRGRRAVQRRRRRQPHDLPDDGGARHLDHHAVDDDAVPRAAPRLAGSLPRRVGGARPAPDLGRARDADLARPGDEGVPEAACPGAGRRPPDGQGRRGLRGADPRRHLRHGGGAVQPPQPGAVDRPHGVRPRPLRARDGARTRVTATRGSRSAAASTSAWAWCSPAWRSRR